MSVTCIYRYDCCEMDFFFQHFHESLSKNPSLRPPGYQPHPETLISPLFAQPIALTSSSLPKKTKSVRNLSKIVKILLLLFFEHHPSKFWRAWLHPWNVPSSKKAATHFFKATKYFIINNEKGHFWMLKLGFF